MFVLKLTYNYLLTQR